MQLISQIIVTFFLFIISINHACAEKLLNPPAPKPLYTSTPQPVECFLSYEEAVPPKTTHNILVSIQSTCIKRGGVDVTHRFLRFGSAGEMTGIVFTCVGENPSIRVFSCQYTTSYEDL